jgi:hypothetical protein
VDVTHERSCDERKRMVLEVLVVDYGAPRSRIMGNRRKLAFSVISRSVYQQMLGHRVTLVPVVMTNVGVGHIVRSAIRAREIDCEHSLYRHPLLLTHQWFSRRGPRLGVSRDAARADHGPFALVRVLEVRPWLWEAFSDRCLSPEHEIVVTPISHGNGAVRDEFEPNGTTPDLAEARSVVGRRGSSTISANAAQSSRRFSCMWRALCRCCVALAGRRVE